MIRNGVNINPHEYRSERVNVALPVQLRPARMFQYLARRGERADRGRDQTLYQFHPLFWNEMTAKQRVVLLDEALLTADPRRDEWPLRLAWYMSSRWAPSWVSKSLYTNGGRLQERLGVILAGACIEHGLQLRKQGRPWLRRQFRGAMDRLATWSPRSLIGGYDIAEDATSPLEDRVAFWPTETVADRLTSARTQSIARRESRSRRPRLRGTSKRSKDQEATRKERACKTTRC